MLVVLFLLSIYMLQWVESNQCSPCACDCGNVPFSTTPPCINCNRMNLEEIPVFGRNLTNSVKTLILRYNYITSLPRDIFMNYTNLEILLLHGNKISNISSNMFTGLRKLRRLGLDFNKIQSFQPHTFRHLEMLEVLGLNGNEINDISNNTFTALRRLKVLYLHYNKIQLLKPCTFRHLEMLEGLWLYGNEIVDISNSTFTGLRRLKQLYLYSNKIQLLEPQTFRHLEMLEVLWLDGNEINDISNSTFTGLRRLKSLWLHNNEIQLLKPNTFRHLEMLKVLSLFGNEINCISINTFTGLRRLKRLWLHNNKIQLLQPYTFRHQEMLEGLGLHNNSISNISREAFTGLRRLKKLDLHNNKIQLLEPQTFRHQEMLEEFSLSHNNISKVMDNTWNGLVRLRYLRLSYNRLQDIRAEMFSNLWSLEHLYLGGNRIHSIERDAFLNIRDLRSLYLSNISMKEIPDALWVPRFSDTGIDISHNPFICSCKLLNDVNQLKFKVNKLHYSSSYFDKQCKNITTTVCEEERNFALGMILDSNCYVNSLTSFYNIADGNYSSLGTCAAPDPCNFYLRINLSGDIVVTNVILKMELSKLGTSVVMIYIGDEISGRYERCNNFTLLQHSGVTFSDNNCASAPVGRNTWIEVISKECPWNSMFRFYEVVVKGYDQNKYNLWSNWGEWSTCSTTCDNGKRIRMRQCNNATSLKCLLPNTNNQRSHNHEDKEICNLGPCFRAVYQWTIGGVCSFFILTLFGSIFWYRKFKMVTYFDGLRPNPNFVMDPDRTLLEQIEELPYDLHWEFPRYDIRFGSVIDEGHFGKVWLAKAKGIKAFNPRDKSDLSSRAKLAKLQDQRVHDYFTTVTEAWVLGDCDTTHHYDVAVKTLKECATPMHERDLANELKLLIYMGRHPNIVNILASCTIRGDLWVILEYCDHGCLKKFLSDRRNNFTPNWSKESVDISMEICFFDLLRMCEQIAKGIMFLSSWRVVHRDISARNILVDSNFNVKIADFGLARSDGFVASPDDIMPIKWSAIESLLRNEYTLKSDMWSVGILYWEIFSLGEVPYPGMTSKEVIHQLKEGYRMDPPKNCPPEIWTIILDCWQTNPDFRPNAAELFEQLDELKVTICSAPDGHYYGTSGGEYDQAGTMQGPSLKMILEGKENMGFKDDESIFPTMSDMHKGADKTNGSGPSTVTYDKYRDLETDILTLQNALSNLNKKVYELEEQKAKIKHVIETSDIHQESIQTIKTILLVDNNMESTIESNTVGNIECIQMTDVQTNSGGAKGSEEEEAVATTVC